MFRFPELLISESENYITLPALKSFAARRKEDDLKTTTDRATLISEIENYANQADEPLEEVLNWFDSVLREDSKELHILKLDLNPEAIAHLKDPTFLNAAFSPRLSEYPHICRNIYDENIKIVKYHTTSYEYVYTIFLYMCKMVDLSDKLTITSVIYPICLDLYVDQGIIVTRGKSKANMFKHVPGEFHPENLKTTNVEKEMKEASRFITDLIGISPCVNRDALNFFRGKLYSLLDGFTQTPPEIQALMQEKENLIKDMSRRVAYEICNVTTNYFDDIESDVRNMVEKYFSITYPDDVIFTRDRDAYPLKIAATDEEDSKVEQTAAFETPLQSKAVFFDNKKMMQKSKLCDGVWFKYRRLNPKYFGKDFNVKIQVKAFTAILKFTEYTAEEDLLHVLFSFIRAD